MVLHILAAITNFGLRHIVETYSAREKTLHLGV